MPWGIYVVYDYSFREYSFDIFYDDVKMNWKWNDKKKQKEWKKRNWKPNIILTC